MRSSAGTSWRGPLPPEPNIPASRRVKQIRYSYRGSPTLLAFSQCNERIRGVMGPFGSGKSSACVVECIYRGMGQLPPNPDEPVGPDNVARTRFAVVRNTYPQLRDTTMKTVFDWLPPAHFGRHYVTDHRYVISGFRGYEIELMFLSLDRPEHVQKLLSLELTGAWVNEAREVPWELIRVLGRRVNRYPSMRDGGCTWHGVWLDTNPPDSDSDWYEFFETNGEKRGRAIFKQPSGLAPEAENKIHLPATYYRDMLEDLTEEEIKVYVHGQYGFLTDGRAVYPEYNDAVHCREDLEVLERKPIKRGWDFGLTPACTLSQMSDTGQKRVIDEIVSARSGVAEFAKHVKMHCAQTYPNHRFVDVGDPAGATPGETRDESCFDVLYGEGIDIEEGNQDVTMRLESVRWGLKNLVGSGEPALVIHPRCRVLRRGFLGGYQHRKIASVSGARYDEKPKKDKHSHPHDALQYDCEQDFGDMVVGLTKNRDRAQSHARDEYDPHFPDRYRDEEPPDSVYTDRAVDADWSPFDHY